MLEDWIWTVSIIVGAIVVVILLVAGSYTVVPPHQAHVVVSRGKGRKVYCAREGFKSSYWKVPIVQQRAIVPIENIQIQVDDVPLRDKNMAKFEGDVVAWLNIIDPLLAAERLGKLEAGLESIKADVVNVIRAVTRNESMYWTIIDIMTKRKEFSQEVEDAVNKELKAWGMVLIELEVIHFVDIEGYTVIKDLEKRQATVINTETRKLVADKNKEAAIVESNSQKEEEMRKAENEQAYRTRQIEKDEEIGEREQTKEMAVAEAEQKANEKKVEAKRTLTVGDAKIEKEATITKAEGEAESEVKRGDAKAIVARKTGEADADVIRAKGFADAESTDKRAEALKKYNEAGIGLEVINASKTVQIEQARAWAEAMKVAKIQVYSGGEAGKLFGMPVSPQAGFNLGAFAEIAKEHGIDLQKIAESIAKGTLPVAEVSKVVEKKQPEETKREGGADVKGKRKSD